MANGNEENLNYLRETVRILRQQTDALREQQRVSQQTTEQNKAQLSLSRTLARIAAEQADDTADTLGNLKSVKDIEKDILKQKNLINALTRETKAANGDLKKLLNEQLINAKELKINQEAKLISAKKIENAFGLTGKSLSTINKLLGGAIPDLEEIRKKTQERLTLLEKQGKLQDGLLGKLQGFRIQLGQVGKALSNNLLDPIVLATSAFTFSDQTTQLQRELGLTESQAENLKVQFRETAAALGDAAVNALTVQKAALTINQALGGFAFTFDTPGLQQLTGEAAKFQEKLGASNEEVAGLTQSALVTGKGFEQIQLEVLGITNQLKSQTGIRLNEAQLLKEASSVTGQIRAQLGGSVVEIGKALAVTKSFGMELKDVKDVSRSLLDFESSISAELEAELLTGKQLNLERARLLALTGDIEGLSREINSQIGDFSDFSNMNVIQQEKIAAAFGMSSDQLSDILLKEANIEELKQKAIANNDKVTLAALEQRTLQQDFNDAVTKLKQIFVDIVGGPVGTLLSMLGEAAKIVANFAETGLGNFLIKSVLIFKAVKGTVGLFKGMKTLLGAINVAKGIGLITQQQSNRAKARATILAASEGKVEKLNNFTKNAGLLTLIGQNAQRTIANVKEAFALGLSGGRLTTEGSITLQKQLQNRSMLGMIAKGVILLGLAIGRAAAAAIRNPFKALLGIGIAAAATAAIISASRPRSAKFGADFETTGPTPLIVGDNPGGKERVTVTPINSENKFGPGNNQGQTSMKETNNIMKEQNRLLAGILAKPNFESVWAGGNETFGNSNNRELKYGSVTTGLS